MQFSVLRAYAATRFRDVGNVVVSDADWKNYINDVYEDMLSRCTWFPWNEAKQDLTILASTRGIALPTDAWHVLAVWDKTNQFPLVPLEGRDQVYNEYPQQTEVGQAMHYHVRNNQLEVYPMPQTDTIYTVETIKRPVDLAADADLPVFPPQYHTTLVEGAVSLAYRDDGNLQMAAQFEAAYEEEVKRMVLDLMQPRQGRYYEPVDTFM